MSDTTEYNAAKGIVFNIQHYSIHDGTGIRTSVFLKGCFLRCIWCQNPESQSIKPELYYFEERCTGCGSCVAACPVYAIRIHRLQESRAVANEFYAELQRQDAATFDLTEGKKAFFENRSPDFNKP